MAADNIISLGFNYDELTAEQKKVIDLLDQVFDKTKQLNGIQINPSTDGLAAFSANLQAQRDAIAALTATYPQLTTAQTANNAAQIEAAKLAKAKADAMAAEERAMQARSRTTAQSTAAIRADAKAASDASNDYKQLSLAYNDAALKAKNYQIQLGANHPLAVQATADANVMGDQLRALDASVGQFQRNVGNYSSAFTGYANTLRGLRGPTKLLGEALGIGAQQADQLRLVLEHSLQGLAAFFRGKAASAAATAADTAAQNANTGSTTINSAATRAGTTAQEGLAVATTETSVAMRIFGTAMKFTGIGLLVAGIGYLVYSFIEFRHAAKEAAEQMKLFNDVMEDANKTAGPQINDLKILYAAANDVTASTKDRMAAVIALKNEFPDYFSQISAEEIMNGKAEKSYNSLTKSIEASSRAKAVKDRKDAIESQKLDINERVDKINNATANESERVRTGETVVQGNASAGGKANQLLLIQHRKDAALLEQQKKMAALDAQNAQLDKISGLQDQAKIVEEQNKPGKTPKTPKGPKDAKDDTFKFDEEAAKSAYEAKKKIQQAELDDLRAMSKDTALSYQLRVDAAKVASMKEQEIIADNVAYEMAATKRKEDNDVKETEAKKQSAKVRASELAAIHKASATKINEINSEAQFESRKQGNASILEVRKLEADALKAARKANEDAQKEGKANIINTHEGKMSDIESAALDKELLGVESLNKRFADGKIGIKEYNQELAKIKDAIEIEKLKAQIEELNSEWNKVALSTDIVGGAEKDKQLSAIGDQRSKAKLALSSAQHREDDQPSKLKTWMDDPKHQAEIDLAKQAQDTIFSFIDDRYEKEKNLIQEKINLIQKSNQTEIAAINSSTLSNQEKAAQITIAEKTAASQTEALKKKQRDEDIKKAKFDKAATILGIVENTAMAVLKAVAASPLTGGMPFSAIAAGVGALQLATVIAQPIPKYEKGISATPRDEWAITGEGKYPELVEEKGKKPYVVNKATLSFLPKNTRVTPLLDNAMQNLGNGAMSNQFASMARLNGMMDIKIKMGEERMADRIVNGLASHFNELNGTMKKQKPPIVNNIKDMSAFYAYKDSQTKR